ncbi:molybdopterin molybdotransferase MoeA [Nemorincola caseinilytica]|uniref:Molybdopterin molybdenumtransferase n=1 Tax=Nemorincola caseinilytica TaxID=2054315 RepID=A0ABP8N8X1_9BACT
MISVTEAEKIILDHARTYGVAEVPLDKAVGRVLAEDILADRDLPPYDRVTMDGIAIRYRAFAEGMCSFRIKATMAAGDMPIDITADDECIELMTGCALPASTDTVVRYEDVEIKEGMATITPDAIRQGANIHRKGRDKQAGDAVALAGIMIDAAVISIAASVGQDSIKAREVPRVVIISTGDELVDVDKVPGEYQIRRSNSYAIKAALRYYGIEAGTKHMNDDAAIMRQQIGECLAIYDVVILSGGVSMGLYDHVPQALQVLGVEQLFHKVRQRPGKPFWFGRYGASGALVFAFPGNPVSAFMCTYRYLVPWLHASLHGEAVRPHYAVLGAHVTFTPRLQYFLQVRVHVSDTGQLVAMPIEGNGSGDHANLVAANAFMELPEDKDEHEQGAVYMIWPFKRIV